MFDMGWTRSCRAGDHMVITPDTHVIGPLPELEKGTSVVHIGPALGARFAMLTVRLEPGGQLSEPPAHTSRFVLVRRGTVELVWGHGSSVEGAGAYFLIPPNRTHHLRAREFSELVVFEKPYIGAEQGRAPDIVSGTLTAVEPRPLVAGSRVQVRVLLPEAPEFDFAVNVMEFAPGATLPQVEIHVMEHGLLMLSGRGIYRLGDHWHPVQAGDVIWMAPYCPQWFGALGEEPALYLLYKDWNRHPLC